MHLRRMVVGLVAVLAVTGPCSSGDGEDGGSVTITDPIGAPEPHVTEVVDGPAPTVAKSALIEIEVAGDELGAAAQEVVDLTTSSRIGGFLVSSLVDAEGYGAGRVLVEVPAARFEVAVGELDRVGNVTRQQLEGADVSPAARAARGRVAYARDLVQTLSRRLEPSDDAGAKVALINAKQELREALRDFASAEGDAAYSSIDVALEGTPPPPPPKRSTFEKALDRAATVTLGIASAIVLVAAVAVPTGLLILLLALAVPRVVRLVKPHLRV